MKLKPNRSLFVFALLFVTCRQEEVQAVDSLIVSNAPFVTTDDCVVPCSKGPSYTEVCDIPGCQCADKNDEYCFHECDVSGSWLMACFGEEGPPLPDNDSDSTTTDGTTNGFKPFENTEECKTPCANVNSFDGDCDSEEVGLCHCVSPQDKYCTHECGGGKWQTMCQSVRPGLNDTENDDTPDDESGALLSSHLKLFVPLMVIILIEGNFL